MPQMAPYNWLILFIFFNLIMIYLISFNHFSWMKLSNYNLQTQKLNKNKFIWMW